jgi:uncharacterized protein (TIGR03067 family)
MFLPSLRRAVSLSAVLLLLPSAGASAAEPKPSGDAAKLQGKWTGWVVIGRGERSDQGPVQLEVVVEGDRITAKQIGGGTGPGAGSDLGAGTFKLGSDGKAKTLDAAGSLGASRNKNFGGIYEIDADTWKWCVNNHNRPGRPAGFETKGGAYYLILKREKR